MDDWSETEAARFCLDVGFDMHTGPYRALMFAYRGIRMGGGAAPDEFDGSVAQLAEIACGRRRIRQFGPAAQSALVYLWFRHLGVFEAQRARP